MNAKKKVIAVDIDDVLSITVPAFVEFSNKRWNMNLTVDEYEENWMRTWGVEAKELTERTEIIKNEFWHAVKHSDEALPVLRRLANDYKLIVTTSRRRDVKGVTKNWIDKYFNGLFEEVHHSGIFDVDRNDTAKYEKASTATKARLCKEIGADYLIDDHVKHCIGVDKLGIKALLFGEYPWNKHIELPHSIKRVKNWSEVEEYFARQSRQ